MHKQKIVREYDIINHEAGIPIDEASKRTANPEAVSWFPGLS